jgi:hypothetical protein
MPAADRIGNAEDRDDDGGDGGEKTVHLAPSFTGRSVLRAEI